MKPLTGRDDDFLKIVSKAAARGDLEALEAYLTEVPSDLTRVGPHGRTLLWEAARGGKADAVRWLAGRGAAIDVPGCYHSETTIELPPLGIARVKKRKAACAALEELGARYDVYTACYLGQRDEVIVALDADADLVTRPLERKVGPYEGYAAPLLAYAVAGGHRDIAADLLERGARVDFPGERLLVWAGWAGDPAIVDLLLRCGAVPAPGVVVDWIDEPELLAVARAHGHDPDVDTPDELGFPPLVDACRGNHNAPDDPSRPRRFLDLGASVNARDHKGKSALHRAAQAGFARITSLLLERGADVHAADGKGETPLFDAVRAGKVGAIPALLAAGADPARRNGASRTPLELARRSRKAAGAAVLELLEGAAQEP